MSNPFFPLTSVLFPCQTLLKFVFFHCTVSFNVLFPVSVLSGALKQSCRLFIPSLHWLFSIGVVFIRPCFYLVSTLFMCMILFFLTIISDKRTTVRIGSGSCGMFSVCCWILLLFVPFRSFVVSMTLVHMWSCVSLSFHKIPYDCHFHSFVDFLFLPGFYFKGMLCCLLCHLDIYMLFVCPVIAR